MLDILKCTRIIGNVTDHYSKITVDDFLNLGAKLESKMHACISSITNILWVQN